MDEYDTFYSDMMDTSDYTELKQRLVQVAPSCISRNHVNVNALFQSISTKFSKFSWFEQVQQQMIKCALQATDSPDSVWDSLLPLLN